MTGAAERWRALARGLDLTGVRLLDGIGDEATADAVGESMLYGLAHAALVAGAFDPDHPDWSPYGNAALRNFNANPDTVYWAAPLRGDATYLIEGTRGTTRMAHVTVFDGQFGFTDHMKVLAEADLDDCIVGEGGAVRLTVSSDKPEGPGGWLPLERDRDLCFVLVRLVACDWLGEEDARLTIQRVDAPIARARPAPGGWGERLATLPPYPVHQREALERIIAAQRAAHPEENVLHDLTGPMPQIGGQAYSHADIVLGPGEAWVAEVAAPGDLAYWSVQLMDEAYSVLDFMYRQSGLNAHTARPDPDGCYRFVVSDRDPGVANWLDKSGYGRVALRFRWLRPEHPETRVRVMPVDAVAEAFPADAVRVTPEDRQAELRLRARGAQMRRRW